MFNRLKIRSAPDLAPVAAVRTVADLQPGESARVGCLYCERAARCERLMAYGLVQGQTVTLIQRSPAYVVRVEETELALDEDVARCIEVGPLLHELR